MIPHNAVQCMLWAFLLNLIVGLRTSYGQVDNNSQPQVTIPQGTVQGLNLTTRQNRNIFGFIGIPYAQPPVGDLRFASPVSADGWNGILNATEHRSSCPQISKGVVVGEEDCLHITVYTPALPKSENASLLPVMVYIYGGAFIMGGSGSQNPTYLLDKDVVLVTPNYRIGPLGFLSTGDEVAPGNWALKDQILALKWVQDNIEYFGGDPGQVTIFGTSAGSACVHLLTLSDSTKGLFDRYITQSGSALSTWAHQPRDYYASRAFELGNYVGCTNKTSKSLIECLRSVDVSEIIATLPQFHVWEVWPEVVWTPTDEPDVEGAVLIDSPANLFARGAIRDRPWMSGVTQNEGLVHTGYFQNDVEKFKTYLTKIDEVLPEMLTLRYQSDSGDAWVKALKSYYFNDDLTTNMSVLLSNQTLLTGDALFYYPAYKAVTQQLALAKSPLYFYIFNYRGTYSQTYFSSGTTVNYGVAHGDDSFYIFSPEARFSSYKVTSSKADLEMVDMMVELWTSFATNGKPTISNGTTTWEAYSTEGNYLQIGDGYDAVLKSRNSYFYERLKFWTKLETESELKETSSAVTRSRNSCLMLLVVYSILVSIFR